MRISDWSSDVCSSDLVRVEPLIREAYAPFGQVIATEGAAHFPINGGMTERFHDLAQIELAGPGARPLLSIARGQPYELPLTLTIERKSGVEGKRVAGRVDSGGSSNSKKKKNKN